MLTLSQLLDRHQTLLCVDAASERVFAGLLTNDEPARWSVRQEGAGTGLFRALEALEVRPGSAGAFLFCDGPGSILGIRTAAMALRTWQVETPRPAYAYASLALAGGSCPSVTLITDARRGLWHARIPGRGLVRVPAQELAGPLATPEGFKSWAELPEGVATVPYDLPALFAQFPTLPLFREAAEPDAFLHEEPSYATWTPQVHRSP